MIVVLYQTPNPKPTNLHIHEGGLKAPTATCIYWGVVCVVYMSKVPTPVSQCHGLQYWASYSYLHDPPSVLAPLPLLIISLSLSLSLSLSHPPLL